MLLAKYAKYLMGVFLLLFLTHVHATHNRGGNITYKHLGGFTYQVTIMTCTYSEAPADRPELPDFQWGDGAIDTLTRDSISYYVHPSDQTYNSQKNYYSGIHTYNGPGSYEMCIVDPNRNAGIINMLNSVNQPFALKTTLVISPFLGNGNNSVQLDECPCPELACVNEIYCYNIAAYDPDGDSLSYKLVTPFKDNCQQLIDGGPTGQVQFVPMDAPQSASSPSGGGGNLSIDPVTGTMCWDSPQKQGVFNFAIEITEYRNGNVVGTVVRDIQLFVLNGCNANDAPDIEPLADTCIIAGTNLLIPIPFSDDVGASISGFGEPFSSNPAAFLTNPQPDAAIDTAYFVWNTGCANVQTNPYPTYFIAQDAGDPVSLQDIETMFITVNGPPVTGLNVTPLGNGMQLSWNTNTCSNILGYKIYRSTDTISFSEDCCSPGAPAAMGYELVGQTNAHGDTTFFDNGPLVIGNDYCYIVTACYPGNAESCVSDQVCAQLKMDVPVITNVSVVTTNVSSGIDNICWAMPKELDTLVQFGNHFFYYTLYRSPSNSFNNASTIVHTTNSSMNLSFVDTCYVNTGLNTVSGPYTYKVLLTAVGESVPSSGVFDDTLEIGFSNEASSVYLSIVPSDNELRLSWNEVVPWLNSSYEVYKETSPGFFTLLATTSLPEYVDTGLVNGVDYCYKIRSIGAYSAPGIINPIYNWSQEVCASPIDLTPPCPPVLGIEDDCELIENLLTWTNPNNSCADDVMSYNLYYAETDTSEFDLIATFNSNTDTTYVHSNQGISIAGCYYVTAIDSAQYGNESEPSNVFCVDNCPYYWVPNIFTPNNDGTNDLFIPFPYRFIESVNAEIYNRWGTLVFQTTDPDLKWDGLNMETNKAVTDGTYYYVIQVNTIRLQGIVTEVIKGHLRVNRGAQYSGN